MKAFRSARIKQRKVTTAIEKSPALDAAHISKVAAYVDATSSEFAARAIKANAGLIKPTAGVLAGPTVRVKGAL